MCLLKLSRWHTNTDVLNFSPRVLSFYYCDAKHGCRILSTKELFLKYLRTLEAFYSGIVLSIACFLDSVSAQCPETKLKENKKLHYHSRCERTRSRILINLGNANQESLTIFVCFPQFLGTLQISIFSSIYLSWY